jgi:hypothetical protein
MSKAKINNEYQKIANNLTREESYRISRVFGPKKQLGVAISEHLHVVLRILALLEMASVSLWIERRIVETLRGLTETGFSTPDAIYAHLTDLHESPESVKEILRDLLQLREEQVPGLSAALKERLESASRLRVRPEASPEPAFAPDDQSLAGLVSLERELRTKGGDKAASPLESPTLDQTDTDESIDVPEV